MTWPHIYHTEHYWPWPYVCTDRQVVMDMTHAQEANGWLSETTLYEYYFNPDTNELTAPGKMHLRWILDYAPASYRSIWIQQVDDPQASQARMQAVRVAAAQIAGTNLPSIQYRVAMPPSRPAVEAEALRRKELQTIPTPRIPLPTSAAGASSTAPGTGSGGGGSGGGGAAY